MIDEDIGEGLEEGGQLPLRIKFIILYYIRDSINDGYTWPANLRQLFRDPQAKSEFFTRIRESFNRLYEALKEALSRSNDEFSIKSKTIPGYIIERVNEAIAADGMVWTSNPDANTEELKLRELYTPVTIVKRNETHAPIFDLQNKALIFKYLILIDIRYTELTGSTLFVLFDTLFEPYWN